MPERPRKRPKTLDHSLNVLLSPEDMTRLRQLAEATSTNMSICVRQAIRWFHAFEVGQAPMCSNGRACLVPHMHAPPPRPPQGEPS